MQQNNANVGGSSFWGTLGGAVTEFASAYGEAYINDKYGESTSEQSEGPTEFANPGTVTQPVYQSQLPSGQPLNLNSIASRLGVSVTVLVVALAAAAYFFFVR